MPQASECLAQGRSIPAALIGELRDSPDGLTDPAERQQRLREDGYLLLRGVLDRDDVTAARGEAFERLVAVGEIRPPAAVGIATGESRRGDTRLDPRPLLQ